MLAFKSEGASKIMLSKPSAFARKSSHSKKDLETSTNDNKTLINPETTFTRRPSVRSVGSRSPRLDDSKLSDKHKAAQRANKIYDPQNYVLSRCLLATKMISLAKQYISTNNLDSLILLMEEMEKHCLTTHAQSLRLAFYLSYGQILIHLSEYARAIQILRILLKLSFQAGDQGTMTSAYLHLGDCYASEQRSEEALRMYFLMLKIALRLGDFAKELRAYDRIGKQYFNLNVMDRAEYFYLRVVEGRVESEDSNLRRLQYIKAIPGYQDDVVEESLEDLADVFFEPMAVDIKYRGFDERRRQQLHYEDNSSSKKIRRVGNVIAFPEQSWDLDPALSKLSHGTYGRRPVNLPLSSLVHHSANRAIKVFDSSASIDTKGGLFRFPYAGRNPIKGQKHKLETALEVFSLEVESTKQKLYK